MTPDEQILTQFPSRRLIAVLGVLQRLRTQAKAGELTQVPDATFHLRGGRDIRGRFLDLAEDYGQMMILIHAISGEPDPQPDVCYFELAELQAITLHNAVAAAEALSFGVIEMPSGTASPTRINLRRRAEDLAQEISSLLHHPLRITIEPPPDTIDELSRQQLGLGLERVAAILRVLGGSAVGQEALASRVSEVRLVASAELRQVDLTMGVLKISFGHEPVPSEEELQDLITTAF
ncbi:MAG: hypothetical protein ACRC8A_10090 [Microcoleaceae cyanobacterium]